MSIEDTQRLVDTITLGAQQAAAGSTLGLGPDETIDILAAKKIQRQAQLAEADEIAGDPFDPNRVIREYANVIQDDEPYPDPFGEYEEVIRDDRGNEIERRRPQDDFQNFDREEAVDRDVLGADFLNTAEVAQQREARGREPGARAGMLDALGRMQAIRQFGGQEAAAFSPEELRQIRNLDIRLQEDVFGNVQHIKDRIAGKRAVAEDKRRREGRMNTADIDREVEARVRAAKPDGVSKFNNSPEDKARRVARPVGKLGLVRKPIQRDADFDPTIFGDQVRAEIKQRNFDEPRRRGAVVEANENKAAALANKYAKERFQRGGIGAQADMAIERIPELQRLGKAGDDRFVRRVGGEDGADFPTAVRVVDGRQPAGQQQTLGFLDPGNVPSQRGQIDKSLFIGAQNEADSANILNAPLPRAQRWMVDNLPEFAGRDLQFPQVDIMAEGQLFADRVRNAGFNVPADIRGLNEFEGGINMILEDAKAKGKPLFRFDEESRKNIQVDDPGVDEVLNLLRYGPADRQRLANALMQMEGGRLNDVNNAQKQAFVNREAPIPVSQDGRQIIFEAPGMRPDGGVPLALIKNEKVGRGKNAKMVGAGLRNIDGQAVIDALKARGEFETEGIIFDRKGNKVGVKPVLLPGAIAQIKAAAAGREDAQKPLFGALKGEGAPRAAFIRGDQRDKSTAELEKQFGPKNARIAKEVENRYKADKERAAQPPSPDSFAQEQRGLDAQFAERGRQAELDKEAMEIGELARLQKLGRFKGEEVALNENPRFRAERLERVGKGLFRERQPIQQAATPTSIAPSPGDVTGSQPAPAMDAGRGGWMGGGGNGRIATSPWASGPEDEGRPLTPGLREELNNLQPTKSPSRGYMVSPDGPTKERERREVNRGLQRENTRKRAGYGAAGAGVAAGLAALIGGEREAREEEAMV